jgi:CBS domain-containing protein
MAMEIKEIMTKNVLTLNPDDTLAEAVKFFSKNKIGGAPVVDNDNKLMGIVTESDIIKVLKTKTTRLEMVFPSSHSLGLTFQESIVYKEIQDAFEDIGQMTIGEIMTKKVISSTPNQPLEEIAPSLLKDHVKRIPIVDEGQVVGIVTRRDIIKGLISGK